MNDHDRQSAINRGDSGSHPTPITEGEAHRRYLEAQQRYLDSAYPPSVPRPWWHVAALTVLAALAGAGCAWLVAQGLGAMAWRIGGGQ